jgi:hypothetical protein
MGQQMTTLATIRDSDLCQAAIERLKCADAAISRNMEWGTFHRERVLWLGLSIKRTSDSPWELIGRRRTKAELLVAIADWAARFDDWPRVLPNWQPQNCA